MSNKLKLIIGTLATVCLCILLVLIVLVRLGVVNESIFSPENPPTQATPTPSASSSAEPEEDEDEYFTISFVGDCTIAGNRFQSLSGGNADYPFANVTDIFSDDEATVANLECIFSDAQLYSDSMFSFKAPVKYVDMLISGGIDFVTTANNHTDDFGQKGLSDTFATLDGAGIPYGEEDSCVVYTTKSGLRLGFYCAYRSLNEKRITEAVDELKAMDVDYIICAFHWGDEGAYRPNASQKKFAHAAIDAGADLVYGSHPHVLQPVEEYGGGIIMYSLGNFCFGGNSFPRDSDSVIAQITLCRSTEGEVSFAALKLIPCSISSADSGNDYRPTLYAEGSTEYARAISKLDGSFKGADLVVDYSKLFPSPSPSPDDGEETPIPSEGVDDPIPVPEPIEPPTVEE